MTTTPPDAPAGNTGGPRPSRDDIRDLGRLRRSLHDRKVAGVAGGLARHLDIDPVILRVAFVVLAFFGGAGLIIYGACWLLVPEEGSESAPVQLDEKSRTVTLLARADNAERLLKPGMFVDVAIRSRAGKTAPRVPQSALISDGDDPGQIKLLNDAYDDEWLADELQERLAGKTMNAFDG